MYIMYFPYIATKVAINNETWHESVCKVKNMSCLSIGCTVLKKIGLIILNLHYNILHNTELKRKKIFQSK